MIVIVKIFSFFFFLVRVLFFSKKQKCEYYMKNKLKSNIKL